MKELRTLLVIDDDDAFRSRLARAFRDRGIDTLEADCSAQALEHLEHRNVDGIVLDLKLGNESGLVLLKRMLEQTPSANVIILTGYGTITTAVDAIKLGAVNYLTKPVDADTILTSFLGGAPVEPAPIQTPALSQVEWDHIQRVIRDCNGNISRASKALGLHRRSLQRKLSKYPEKLR